jgi:hypothetical protein
MVRYKPDYVTSSALVYKRFLKEHPNINISSREWANVLKIFNELFLEYALQTGERTKLPFGFGTLAISKKKTIKIIDRGDKKFIGLPIDWTKTHQLGKRVYLLNTHSDGYRCRWFWFKRDSNIGSPEIWMFRPSRTTSRMMARYLNDEDGLHYLDKYQNWEKRDR